MGGFWCRFLTLDRVGGGGVSRNWQGNPATRDLKSRDLSTADPKKQEIPEGKRGKMGTLVYIGRSWLMEDEYHESHTPMREAG